MRKISASALAIVSVLVVSSSSSYAFGGRMGSGGPITFRGGVTANPGFPGHMGVFGRSPMGGGLNHPAMNVPTQLSRGGWPDRTNQLANNLQPGNRGGFFPSNRAVNGNYPVNTYPGGRGGLWNVGQLGNSGRQNVAMNAPSVMPPMLQTRPMPTTGYSQPVQAQPTQSSSSISGFDQTVQSIGSTVTSVLGTVGAISALF
jgi:hypothetical protein